MDERIGPDQWDAAIADTDGPQLVVAGPGAGKTEFLIRRLIRLIGDGVDPGGIHVLTFARRGATDLRNRFEVGLDRLDAPPALLQAAGAVDIATFHSLAARILETHGPTAHGWDDPPTLLTGPEQLALVRELLADDDPAAWPPGLRGLLGSQSFAEEVADFILRATEHLLDPDDLREAAVGRSDWAALPGFIERYRRTLRERHRIDYGTLMLSAVETLRHPDVVAQQRVTHVLVDEYQDTTRAQTEFLAALIAPGTNLTVAADPYQSIYSFRGAELANVDDFPTRFPRADGSPATRRVLTTSFRVPEAILRSAERLTSGELPGGAGRVESAGPGGRVDVHAFGQRAHEADWIAGEIHRINLVERIPFSRMAVLVRSTRRFLPTLSRSFDRRGIPHERPDVRLVDHPALRVVADIVTVASKDPAHPEAERAIRRLLLSPVVGLAPGAERDALRRHLHHGTRWSSIVADLGFPGLAGLLDDDAWATKVPAAEGFWRVWRGLASLQRLALADPEWRAALASASQMLDRLGERDEAATLAEWLTDTGAGDFEAVPLLPHSQPDTDTVTITTLHQSKGLDFDVVFIADAVDGVLPDLRRNASLLNTHLLPVTRRTQVEASRFRIQEEMRLAYTAMTRASARVVWTTTSASIDENEDRPSRFLDALVDVATIGTPRPSGSPITPLEAEAELRRILTDPDASAASRFAALATLTDASLPHLRPATDYPGVAERGPDRGIIAPDHHFSPSQGNAYETCPRQYVLERHLLVGGEPTINMTFGSLIHEVAEIADRAAMERGDAHATVDEALAVLDDRFDPADYGPHADDWYQRGVLALERLYGLAPNAGWRTVSVERELRFELDGTLWKGRADRIDTDGTGVRVIDYKTTKNGLPSHEKAAVDLQLGLYALAAGSDPDVSVHGPVKAAELWYPLYPTKSFSIRRLVLENLPLITERMAAISAGVLAETFPATPSNACERCPVRTLCDQWSEGREAFVA